MKPMDLLIGLGLAGAAYWWYTKPATGTTPATAPTPTGQTPISSNGAGAGAATGAGSPASSGSTITQGTNNPPATPPPAPAATPSQPSTPAGYASVDGTGGAAPNFSQWVSTNVGPGRQLLSADDWNYYFSKFSGVQQTADLFNPADRGELINAGTYMQRRIAAGLSGLVQPTGLSPAVPHVFRSAGGYVRRKVV